VSKRIVILGGGMSGLVAAWALRDLEPVLIEGGPCIGGDFARGGLKLLRSTPYVGNMLLDLGCRYSPANPRGGILYRGSVWHHPGLLRSMDADQRYAIQSSHWSKTRGHPTVDPKCMDDPMGDGPQESLNFDFGEFKLGVSKMMGERIMLSNKVIAMTGDSVITDHYGSRRTVPFDYAIITLPRWLASGIVPFTLEPTKPATLVIVTCENMSDMDERRQWDYIYTPELLAVHRVVLSKHGAQLEVSSKHPVGNLLKDIAALGEIGYKIEAKRMHTIPGHLEFDSFPATVPENMLLLGRYAEWNSRALTHTSLERVMAWRAERGI